MMDSEIRMYLQNKSKCTVELLPSEIFRKNSPFYARVIIINHRSKFSSSFSRYDRDDKLVSFRYA